MSVDINFNTLLAQFENLKHFNFSYTNPMFWAALAALFFILLIRWQAKKAFSFCFIIGLILLASTKIEVSLGQKIAKAGGALEPLFIRGLAVSIIAGVVIYYIFAKD